MNLPSGNNLYKYQFAFHAGNVALSIETTLIVINVYGDVGGLGRLSESISTTTYACESTSIIGQSLIETGTGSVL